ncbi:MAG: prepilin-type N-terminal cleavage/methylation domain-containing protein, partial [Gemmatimonadota bacterium]|nr:prepilin-type N-terminal cleavage/methylation domain-containing protein [Gemmatimonadota bacterium]
GMRARPGFTIIELMISMMIGLVVLGAVYKLMITQTSGYGKQRELADVRETARSGSTLLSRDLRHAASGGGGVVAMSPSSITLRSIRGVGIVCAKHPTLPRYALSRTAGKIESTADDSAVVYQVGREKWQAVKVTGVGTPAAMGIAACAWPGSPVPSLVIEVATNTNSIKVGAPFRAFRRVQYAQYLFDDRWWLGRKVGASPDYEQLTGPLRAAGGLAFSYFDTLGAPTATPGAVGMVAFTLNAESYKKARLNSGQYAFQRDSLTSKVLLRR